MTLLKVCGATTADDIELIASAGADLVGLWHGVPGGPADLTLEAITALAEAARATGRLEPVLVTFSGSVEHLRTVLDRTGIRTVQLHAYQPPMVVRALTGVARVFKVLHLKDGECLEGHFLGSYERAGTDMFLLDNVTGDGRIGSTGQRLDPADVDRLAARLNRPYLLAGGLRPEDAGSYSGMAGIDVDTAARDASGRFSPAAIAALTLSWQTSRIEELT